MEPLFIDLADLVPYVHSLLYRRPGYHVVEESLARPPRWTERDSSFNGDGPEWANFVSPNH